MPVMGMVVVNDLPGFRIMGVRAVVGMRVVMVVIMRVRMAVLRLDQGIGGPVVAGASAIIAHGVLRSCCVG